jgi:signal transduction histidine kinase
MAISRQGERSFGSGGPFHGRVVDGEPESAVKQRAAKLASANRALRETAESLRTADDLDLFLGLSLRVMAEQLASPLGFVFVLGQNESLRLAWLFERGALIRGAEAPAPFPYGRQPIPKEVYRRRWRELGFEGGVPDVFVNPEPGWTEEHRAFLRAKRVGSMVTVPMVLDAEIVGTFAVGLEGGREPSAEDRELVQTIPIHASLALRMTRLADDARVAAAARQEEQAARLRAESLAAWRSKMDRAVERLAASPDLDASLGQVLIEVVQQLRAVGGGIWRAEEDGLARLILSFEAGEVRTVETSHHPALKHGERVPRVAFGPKHEIRVDDQTAIANRPDYAPFREYLAEQGIRSVLLVPMYLGDTLRGGLSLRFAENRVLNTEERELLETFATHAVLAMELTRLSQAARAAAVTEERNRLARDIHDTVAQGLAIIIRQLELVALAGLGKPALDHIAIAVETARESLVDARRSIRALRPALVEGRTLEGALQDLVQRSRRLSSAEIRWTAAGFGAAVPFDVENQVLGIAQEALTNALKHAAASIIDVGLWMHAGVVSVSIRDNGAGFDPGTTMDGIGRASMRERAARIGATVTVASEPGSGTEVVVSWSAASLKAGPHHEDAWGALP